ncbi:MAG: translesion DNA synthesis-associated protein ImuA [Burkholderiales bacterium]|nr:translesion DNA synthesis-associated protein ImuA [Burkholderiales bacterium]
MNPAHNPILAQVHADVWHANTLATAPAQVLPTGDAALDAQLPGGGWPVGALSEILQPAGVHSEWRLLLPALAHSGSGAVVLVGPPQPPFAPALAAQGLHTRRLLWVAATLPAQRLWAAEQALRCADVDAVLAWLPQARADQLRRLQMAAASFNKLLWVLRPEQVQHDSSPAVLRVWVCPWRGVRPQSQQAVPLGCPWRMRPWRMGWRCVCSSAGAPRWRRPCTCTHAAHRWRRVCCAAWPTRTGAAARAETGAHPCTGLPYGPRLMHPMCRQHPPWWTRWPPGPGMRCSSPHWWRRWMVCWCWRCQAANACLAGGTGCCSNYLSQICHLRTPDVRKQLHL